MLELDTLDRRILNHIQGEFPLVVRPFQALGDALGISEDLALERVSRLKEAAIIRQISAIFDTRALGYQSTLVAMRIAPERLDAAAAVVSRHPGVSHNYHRVHAYNLWFTIALPPQSSLPETLARLHQLAGAEATRSLPALKLFKIGVRMDLTGDEGILGNDGSGQPRYTAEDRDRALQYCISGEDIAVIRALQEDVAVEVEPFSGPAAAAGLSQEALLAHGSRLQSLGVLRRFAAILRHREAGFSANAMSVWSVPGPRTDEVGQIMAEFNAVTHCYLRSQYADWPYNIFAMIHGRTPDDCLMVSDAMAQRTDLSDYALLYSQTEYKKTRLKYYSPEFDEWEIEHLGAKR